jgi:hypothetical protein
MRLNGKKTAHLALGKKGSSEQLQRSELYKERISCGVSFLVHQAAEYRASRSQSDLVSLSSKL